MSTPMTTTRLLTLLVLIVGGGAAIVLAWNIRTGAEAQKDLPSRPPSVAQFHEAADKGNIEALKKAIESKIDPNARNNEPGPDLGMTALMYAARSGQVRAVSELLATPKISIDAATADGQTALMCAIMAEDVNITDQLIRAKANVNARRENGLTALMLAAARGPVDNFKALLQAGADVNARNRWQETVLLMVARTGNTEKLEALLSVSPDVNVRDAQGEGALHRAIQNGASTDFIKLLIDRKVDVNGADQAGVTPLMRAAGEGNADVARMLLAAKADANAKDSNGWTAEVWAKNRGDERGAAVLAVFAKP